MILRLLLLFTSLILLGSCDKVIHKNGARAENALDSMIEQYSYPENDNFTNWRFGNLNSNDWYVFSGVTITYTFGQNPCFCAE